VEGNQVTDDVSYFDPDSPGRGVCLQICEMDEEQYALFAEDFYAGLIAPDVFGVDANGEPIAPHGMSVHGVPRLRPEDD
jgi:hypothetical protein